MCPKWYKWFHQDIFKEETKKKTICTNQKFVKDEVTLDDKYIEPQITHFNKRKFNSSKKFVEELLHIKCLSEADKKIIYISPDEQDQLDMKDWFERTRLLASQ